VLKRNTDCDRPANEHGAARAGPTGDVGDCSGWHPSQRIWNTAVAVGFVARNWADDGCNGRLGSL